jgi:hypothetical protein
MEESGVFVAVVPISNRSIPRLRPITSKMALIERVGHHPQRIGSGRSCVGSSGSEPLMTHSWQSGITRDGVIRELVEG